MFHVIKLLMLEKRGEQGQGLTKRELLTVDYSSNLVVLVDVLC